MDKDVCFPRGITAKPQPTQPRSARFRPQQQLVRGAACPQCSPAERLRRRRAWQRWPPPKGHLTPAPAGAAQDAWQAWLWSAAAANAAQMASTSRQAERHTGGA